MNTEPPMQKDNQDNVWNQRYNTETYVYGTQPNDFLYSVAKNIPENASVLCLAEGEGRNAVYLAERGHRVLAVDASHIGLDKAKRLAEQRNVSIECQIVDLTEFAIDNTSWDAIISIFAHLPPPVRRELHQQVISGLRTDGVFILEAYTPEQLKHKTGGPPVADLMMTLAELRQELSGLKLLHAVELERELMEGELHHGLGAVVQVMAKK